MSEDEWIIEMQEERELLDVRRELEILNRRCICKVPSFIKDQNKSAYTPKVVSLGPYHHHDHCKYCDPNYLKQMEPIKHKTLMGFLQLKSTELKHLKRAMKDEVKELMDAYEGLEKSWTDENRFTELMILDGCFVLAMILFNNDRLYNIDCFGRSPLAVANFNLLCVCEEAFADMLLLENQVPFRAVQILADLLMPPEMLGNDGLKNLMLRTFMKPNFKIPEGTSYHLLALIRESYALSKDFIYKDNRNMGTVTELAEKGVSFERSIDNTISFNDGVLRLQNIYLSPQYEHAFFNMMAYEKMNSLDPNVLTFVAFMNCLIDKADDVTLLREKGIITGWMGSDEEIASLYNRLVKQVTPPKPNTKKDGKGIDEFLTEYCSKRWHRWWASFKQLYLKNPWVFISMLGGIILLILTLLQVIYQVSDYYK